MKIGILGGSFNPIHRGHIKMAKYAIDKIGLDKLIFVPAFKSPFKSKEVYEEANHRVKMIEDVLEDKMVVSLFEINRKGTSYTIDTVKYFSQKYKDAELFFIIGSDNLYKLHKWREIDAISNLCKITIFKRGVFSKENIKKYDCLLLDNPLYDFSSTEFRRGITDNVAEKTKEYIGFNQLYIKDIMINMLDPKRHKHSMSVANYATKYAKQIGVSAKDAWVAGALHDITKSWTIDEHRDYLYDIGVDEEEVEDFELHSLTGYHWVKDEYKLGNEEILNAILKHTSLAEELTDLDKVIFAADKLCEGRKYPGIQKDRELIEKDFHAGFKVIVKKYYDTLQQKKDLNNEIRDIYKRWI